MAIPSGFVYLDDIAPSIIQDIRYASSNNFVGRPITGYLAPRCILTLEAAQALTKLQASLQSINATLVVYDCYRPDRAVADFVQWSQNNFETMKQKFYPRENKANLFKKGYIAKYSAHSRGSTIDLSIYQPINDLSGVLTCYAKNRKQENSIDMGTNYDCLDKLSHVRSSDISEQAKKNRTWLANLMKKFGFKPYSKEWWHFTLKNEPIKKTYFNFVVK